MILKKSSLKLEVKWRTWYKGVPPQPIKLEIPGWAGDSLDHEDGSKPQPWHCPPFVDGSTYGLELIYPFDTECHVKTVNGKVKFQGDFKEESPWNEDGNNQPPFANFAPHHYGFTSSLDLKPPPGYVTRLESHPRFYTDTSDTVPVVVPGHIQEWWSRIFFVVFKAPSEGCTHIFRKGEPYAQVLFVPQKVDYDLKQMSSDEAKERESRETTISMLGNKFIANNRWKDHKGYDFDDKYKVLSSAFAKHGYEGVDNILQQARKKTTLPATSNKKIKRRLILPNKNEKT